MKRKELLGRSLAGPLGAETGWTSGKVPRRTPRGGNGRSFWAPGPSGRKRQELLGAGPLGAETGGASGRRASRGGTGRSFWTPGLSGRNREELLDAIKILQLVFVDFAREVRNLSNCLSIEIPLDFD